MHPLDLLTSWTEALLAEREEERLRFEGLQKEGPPQGKKG